MIKMILLIFSLLAFSAHAVDPMEAYTMSKEGKAVLIDVREKEEVREGMVKGAKWFPLSSMEGSAEWKDSLKEITDGKRIFLYCRSGRRSEKAKNILKSHNITSENIGGFEKLKKILPVEKPELQ